MTGCVGGTQDNKVGVKVKEVVDIFKNVPGRC